VRHDCASELVGYVLLLNFSDFLSVPFFDESTSIDATIVLGQPTELFPKELDTPRPAHSDTLEFLELPDSFLNLTSLFSDMGKMHPF